MAILAMWLALSSAIYSRIALSFALNRIFSLNQWKWDSKKTNQSDFKAFFKLTNYIAEKTPCLANLATWFNKYWYWPKSCSSCIYTVGYYVMRFQNGFKKKVTELREVQFWSEIILMTSNFENCISTNQSEWIIFLSCILLGLKWYSSDSMPNLKTNTVRITHKKA